MKSKNKGVVSRKPYPDDPIQFWEGETREVEVKQSENTSGRDENKRDIYFPYSDKDTHYPHNQERSHHIVGNIPERTIDIDGEEGKWMKPRKKGST